MSEAPMEPSLRLPPGVWAKFLARSWGRRPAVIKNPFGGLGPGLGEIVRPLLAASDEQRRSSPNVLRVFLEHEHRGAPVADRFSSLMLGRPTGRHLPASSDASLDAYAARMKREFPGQRFGLILSGAHAYDRRHWLMMRSFLADLYPRVGVPSGGAGSVVFVGNYRHTPFGIHKDTDDIFMFVVRGPKTMKLWPLETFLGRPEISADPSEEGAHLVMRDRADHDRAMRLASAITGEAGDILYWPHTYWHRSEPAPGLNATISLGLKFSDSTLLAQGWPGPALSLSAADLPGPGATARPVPARIAAGLRAIGARGTVLEMRRAALREWAEFATGLGLRGSPRSRPLRLRPGDLVRADPSRPVIRVANGPETIFSCNGRSMSLWSAPQLRRIADALNTGRVFRIADLERGPGRARAGDRVRVTGPALRDFLETLQVWGAIEAVSPPDGGGRAA